MKDLQQSSQHGDNPVIHPSASVASLQPDGKPDAVPPASFTHPDETSREGERNAEEHVHVHVHTDGTVHNHYHRHAAGAAPHDHAEETVDDHIHFGHPESDSGNSSLPANRGVLHEVHEFSEKTSPLHSHMHKPHEKTILTVNNLAYRYPGRNTPVLQDISFEACAGSILSILGNNGAGKSTLLSILTGMRRPTQGSADLVGSDIAKMNKRQVAKHIASVAQQQRIPHMSVYDQVLLGRKPHMAWSISEYDRLVVSNTIEQMGLEKFATRYIDELSGGERQKVFIARALAQEPAVLLLDEPTSTLDPKNQMEVLELIRDITKKSSLATVIVIHDINLALRFSDQFLLMHNGKLVACGGKQVVNRETLTATYDYAMRIEQVGEAAVAIPCKDR